MQENDKALLEFGGDDDEDSDAEDARSAMEVDSKKKGKGKAEPKVVVVTKDLLKSWQKEMLQVRPISSYCVIRVTAMVADHLFVF